MRHKYDTRAIVLSRTHIGEANTVVTLLTSDLGVVKARAQSVRRSGAKLAGSLVTLCEAEVMLVRGKEGWRLVGAVLHKNWFRTFTEESRSRALRITGLVLRFVQGEEIDTRLFSIVRDCFQGLIETEGKGEEIEMVTILRILSVLGLDTGDAVAMGNSLSTETLKQMQEKRAHYIKRINAGIEASGL